MFAIIPHLCVAAAVIILSACATVPTVAVLNLVGELENDLEIGYRSAPAGTTTVRLKQGVVIGDVLQLANRRAIYLVPYNSSSRVRSGPANQFFGIGLKVLASADQGKPLEFSLQPNNWVLILSDGTVHHPLGHRIVSDPSSKGCLPGYQPKTLPTLDNPLTSQTLIIDAWSSQCVELYFPISAPPPADRFELYIDSIHEQSTDYGPRRVEFREHYGK